MIRSLVFAVLFLATVTARAQIQLDVKFKRLQYIAYEPVIATATITNLIAQHYR
jgi:hypothetical protein